MKKFVKKFFQTFAVVSAFTTAASVVYTIASNVKKDRENKRAASITVDLPQGWTDFSGLLNTEAIIEAGNKESDSYMIAIPYQSEQYESFDHFCQYVLQYMNEMYQNYSLLKKGFAKINGVPACVYDGTLEFETILYQNIVAAVDFKDRYVFAMAWAPIESTAKQRDEMITVIESIKQTVQ